MRGIMLNNLHRQVDAVLAGTQRAVPFSDILAELDALTKKSRMRSVFAFGKDEAGAHG